MPEGQPGEVTFTVQLPADMATRSFGDGTTATTLNYAIYEQDAEAGTAGCALVEGTATFTNFKATVTERLLPGKTYKAAFWAASAAAPYTFNADAMTMTVNTAALKTNDENGDGFFGSLENISTSDGAYTGDVTLTRPFAQVNVGTNDYEQAQKLGLVLTDVQTSLSIPDMPTGLNLFEGTTVTGSEQTANFATTAIPADGETFPVAGTPAYKYLAMAYVLMPKAEDKSITTVTFNSDNTTITPAAVVWTNVPVQRNFRTNIYGSLLTNPAQIDVEINPEWGTPDYTLIEGSVPAEITLHATHDVLVRNAVALNGVKLNGTGKITFENVKIMPIEGNAVTLAENAAVTMVVSGSCVMNGGKGGDGIEVPAGASLDLSGTGALTCVGNGGADGESISGSGIGNALNNVGNINIHDLASLTAQGYGSGGFGIGGKTKTLNISKTTVEYACGGFIQPNYVNDPKYGKSEPEGGAAIGIDCIGEKGTVNLTDVVVKKADGGSKSAGIGGRFWTSLNLNITNCTITNVTGGNASAGIGGSRCNKDVVVEVVIDIRNSTLTGIQGGEHGAGVGSGYDTYCAQAVTPSVSITVDGTSTIAATGGKYAAGLGTGFHIGMLTGSVAAGADISGCKAGTPDAYKAGYTIAQNVGYGVVDPAREYKDKVVTFTVGGTVIAAPEIMQ